MRAKSLQWLLTAAACCVSSAAPAQVQPTPVSFQFTFCSADNAATASGFITFDQNQMNNPFVGITYNAVLDLQVTVAGAGSGNGTYGRADFGSIAWNSNGGTMDFGSELVGQSTDQWDWGTEGSSGQAGDFNLFRTNTTAGSPEGVFYFVLAADEGNADTMTLRTFSPGPAAIPEPACPPAPGQPSVQIPTLSDGSLVLLVLLLTGVAAAGHKRLSA